MEQKNVAYYLLSDDCIYELMISRSDQLESIDPETVGRGGMLVEPPHNFNEEILCGCDQYRC